MTGSSQRHVGVSGGQVGGLATAHGARRLLRTADRFVTGRVLAAIYVVAAVAYVVICLHLPVQFNTFADKDDAYFVRAAQSMLAGDWLGTYNQITLIKGPGFAYFLALNHLLGVSTTLSISIVFVVACGVLVRVSVRHLGLPRIAALALFVALLYQPALMPSRIIRDGLYQSLLLLTLAGMIALTLSDRVDRLWPKALMWGVPLGLLWITREEGIWVAPAFALLVLVKSWSLRRHVRTQLLPFAAALVAFGVGAATPVVATSAVNHSVYGTFTVTDINAAPFQSALKALDTIDAGPEIPHVLVSMEALDAAFAASPAFEELRPSLTSADNIWLLPGCSVYRETCGQFGGGWFGWAVRDAAFQTGHYSSAAEASRFYNQVATEIDAACARGELTCRSSILPIGPVVTTDTLRELPETLASAVRLTAYGDGATPPLITTVGTPELVQEFRSFYGDPLTTTAAETNPVVAPEDASRWVRGKETLSGAYRVVTPAVLALGAIAFGAGLVMLVLRRGVNRRLLLAAGTCWTLYATRLGLIALIDITSSPAVTAEYLAPAFLLVWIAATFSLLAVVVPRPREDRGEDHRKPGAPDPVAQYLAS